MSQALSDLMTFHLVEYSEAINDKPFWPNQFKSGRDKYNRIIIKTSFRHCGCVVTTKLQYRIIKQIPMDYVKEYIEDQHFTEHPVEASILPLCELCGIEPVIAGNDVCIVCSGGITAEKRLRRFLIYRNVHEGNST